MSLTTFANRIEAVTLAIGSVVAWCAVLMVAIEFVVVLLRHVFGIGHVGLQESVIYLHATLIMLGTAAVLARDRHVRVDIVFTSLSEPARAHIDLFGALLFVLPLAILTGYASWSYVARSWTILERSKETSGLPLVFALKSLIPAFAVLVGLQGLAMAARAAVRLARPRPGGP